MVFGLFAAAEGAVEGHVDDAEHVEGRQQGGAHRQVPEDPVDVAEAVEVGGASGVGAGQDFVFGEEAGEDRDAGDRQGCREKSPVGGRHVLSEAAHSGHVLFARVGVDHRSGAEEQAGLEEGVGHDVEDGDRESADPGSEEHVAELGNGRVGEDLFDVVLDQGDGGSEDGGDAADDRNDHHGGRTEAEEDVAARNDVDARGDHRCGVDQGRHRGRSGHRIGQPDIEWNLRRLADRTDEEKQRDDRRCPGVLVWMAGGGSQKSR